MDYDFPKSNGYRSLMTGLFVGLFATLACLVFNLIYRRSTGFMPTDIINIATLTFVINLVFPVIGIIFNAFLKWHRKGEFAFMGLFGLLFLFFIWKAIGVDRFGDQLQNHEFRTLLTGVLLILGISAVLFLPFLFHNRKFEEHVV